MSYLDVSGDVSLGKRGGNKTITISTDANDINIDVQESSNWIDVIEMGDTLSINVVPNTDDERSAYITVNTYSSFFGIKFNCTPGAITRAPRGNHVGPQGQSRGPPGEITWAPWGNKKSTQYFI